MGAPTRLLAGGAALLLVLGFGPTAAAPPQARAEVGVRRALVRLNAALAKRDMALLDDFAPDATLIGSDAGEVARGRAELEAHIRQIYALPVTLSFSWRAVEVSAHGAVAWLYADGEVVTHGPAGDERKPYRLTGVLELKGGRWIWRQFHGSEPAHAA